MSVHQNLQQLKAIRVELERSKYYSSKLKTCSSTKEEKKNMQKVTKSRGKHSSKPNDVVELQFNTLSLVETSSKTIIARRSKHKSANVSSNTQSNNKCTKVNPKDIEAAIPLDYDSSLKNSRNCANSKFKENKEPKP